jgi:hypothetical protein
MRRLRDTLADGVFVSDIWIVKKSATILALVNFLFHGDGLTGLAHVAAAADAAIHLGHGAVAMALLEHFVAAEEAFIERLEKALDFATAFGFEALDVDFVEAEESGERWDHERCSSFLGAWGPWALPCARNAPVPNNSIPYAGRVAPDRQRFSAPE